MSLIWDLFQKFQPPTKLTAEVLYLSWFAANRGMGTRQLDPSVIISTEIFICKVINSILLNLFLFSKLKFQHFQISLFTSYFGWPKDRLIFRWFTAILHQFKNKHKNWTTYKYLGKKNIIYNLKFWDLTY